MCAGNLTAFFESRFVSFALLKVGVGFSSSGSMAGGDFVMAAFDQNTNKPIFSDRHAQPATGVGLPIVDASQDSTLIELSEANGITTLHFRRKLNTCDRDDYTITTGTTRVLFAYHPSDKPIDDFTMLTTPQHTFRTSKSLDLFQSPSRIINRPTDFTSVLDVRFNNTMIPGGERTRYW